MFDKVYRKGLFGQVTTQFGTTRIKSLMLIYYLFIGSRNNFPALGPKPENLLYTKDNLRNVNQLAWSDLKRYRVGNIMSLGFTLYGHIASVKWIISTKKINHNFYLLFSFARDMIHSKKMGSKMSSYRIHNLATHVLRRHPDHIGSDNFMLSCADRPGSFEQVLPQKGEPMK